MAQAKTADPAATPVVGQDRYKTSTLVASGFFSAPSVVTAALGTNFPDSLAGGAHAAAKVGPPLLVNPSAPLPDTTTAYLKSVKASVASGYLYGGPLAVGEDVRGALWAAIS